MVQVLLVAITGNPFPLLSQNAPSSETSYFQGLPQSQTVCRTVLDHFSLSDLNIEQVVDENENGPDGETNETGNTDDLTDGSEAKDNNDNCGKHCSEQYDPVGDPKGLLARQMSRNGVASKFLCF